MKHEFMANQIEIGDDDAEEVYSVQFTETGEGQGPPPNYLLLQRSVAGIGDKEFAEPYIELNDPSNGRFAEVVESGELLPTYFHLLLKKRSGIFANPNNPVEPVSEIVVRFDADGPLLRKLRYALSLVISDGFKWQSLA